MDKIQYSRLAVIDFDRRISPNLHKDTGRYFRLLTAQKVNIPHCARERM